MSKYGVFSGPYFPAFGPNTERKFVSLRIKSECGKTRENTDQKKLGFWTLFSVPKRKGASIFCDMNCRDILIIQTESCIFFSVVIREVPVELF